MTTPPQFSAFIDLIQHDMLHSDLAVSIRKQIVQAISDYNLIEPHDRVLVAVSGGKDSSILLALLNEIRKKAPFPFEIQAAILDQKQPGFFADTFLEWVRFLNIPIEVIEEDTYSIVTEKVPENKTYCSLCSRLRRGILYTYAQKNGFSKIALGHHRDDLIETLFLNLMYGGRMASMPPKLFADDGKNIVIRPMSYVKENELIELSKAWRFPVVPCNLCGSQEGLKRQQVKKMITELRLQNSHFDGSLLKAMSNVQPNHLLDKSFYQ